MFADLHLHSHFSDGTFAPAEIVSRGRKQGLGALSLTDHDTVEGCVPMAEECSKAEMEFVVGTELTSEHKDNELHILGYFFDPTNEPLLAAMAKFQKVRQDRIREMVAAINRLGVSLNAEDVFALANCKSPGRPHVARTLVKQGQCRTLDEAFERFLKKGRPAWVPKSKMSSLEAIELIHQAGGLAVMAHPGLNRTDEVIPDLVSAGLDGIECFHTKHPPAMSRRYLDFADKYSLLVTGGSDCHGMSKGRPLIGNVRLSRDHYDKLKARAKSRKPTAKLQQSV
jgi:predicted metal-dependent phosphoesterase TrpH